MKKIVVFGATGNTGCYFIDYLHSHLDLSKYQVIAVGRKTVEYGKYLPAEYHSVDIRYSNEFSSLPQRDIAAVVNMAGLLPAYLCEYSPNSYIDTNITGAVNILEYARKVNADRVLYTQTWADLAGYWGHEEVLSPNFPRKYKYTGDHAFYAISKGAVVDFMEHYHQEYGIKNFVFRLPNIYLYHPLKTYYVNCVEKKVAYRYMIDRAINGLDIEMWGNPNAFKDIVYVKDLCQMMYKALFAAVDGGTYNVGTGKKTTLREQIEGIIQVFSHDHMSTIIECPEKSSFTSFVMDIENARQDLDYEPQFDYISLLQDYKQEMNKKRFHKVWGFD